ncbi:histidine kinase [Solwaraspora sp. WMMB335]|uniref:sensor histidine kinase n=1 Tax=Solwaraspora sp. WMMB335 TaxID=3404118 RepID=UPI003B93B02C
MRELFRSGWAEPRAADPPARLRRDWALVAVVAPLVLIEGLLRPELPARVFSVVILLALVPTLLWRRTRPLLMVAIAFTVTGLAPLVIGHEPELVASGYLLILPYALFRWGSGREMVAGAALILTKVGLSGMLGYLSFADALAGFVVMFAAFALATASRYRASLWARNLDQAKLLERERLARDLHDTVAHHVSAMAIRAQAGIAVAPHRPDAAVDALRVIEAEATSALGEMRTMVRDLRHSSQAAADLAPNPGIPEIAGLTDRSPPGPEVDVQLLGDFDGVPATVGTAIYRLAQEAVTNARRHARHATRIEVRVEADADSVCLRVSDDGDTSQIRPATAGGSTGATGSVGPDRPGRPVGFGLVGFGLVGMAERAGLLGGTCLAGPSPDRRGWTVAVTLPRSVSAG